MNLNYIIQRKHMFKKRRLYWINRSFRFKMGNLGLFSLKPQRFELVYLRRFKKAIRRRHIRIKSRFRKRKFWFFLRPNCILSGKSVNSRMGAGVGNLVRIAINLKAYHSFVEFKKYSPRWARKLNVGLRFRIPLKFQAIARVGFGSVE